MIKVLHHSSCSKSIAVLEHLDENGVPFEIINIIEDPLSELEIRTVLKKLGFSVQQIIRKSDKFFVEHFADKTYTDDEWIAVLHRHPELIQRPILIKGPIAIIGRPVENVKLFVE